MAFCYQREFKFKLLTRIFIMAMVGTGIVLFVINMSSAFMADLANADVEGTKLPSGDIVCKRYRTGFTKCEDIFVVCYYDRSENQQNMECFRKDLKSP